TGTEYSSLMKGTRAPEKVVVSHTAQGKTVTGTALGNTNKLTGIESGSCVGVTGTEYLSTEQFASMCNTTAPETPRKVTVMSSQGQQEVSGTGVGRSKKVTGDESGSCRTISGSQYYNADNFGALCSTPSPQKVASMQTLAGRTLTGTAVGRSTNVTGDERGGCKPVTGTEYIGSDQQKAVCGTTTPVAPVAKVAVDQTWRGQSVTGAYVGRSERVTGDESGGCSPISGTPYIGRGQYNGFCAAPALGDQEARIRTGATIPALTVTGDRPGAGGTKMTGDERGACGVISGTPYIGVDNTVSQCAPTSGRFVPRPSTWEDTPRAPAPLDFSIKSPARVAQIKQSNDVTGTGYSSDRITGPANKANGLITGTPEFRHRDLPQQAPVVQQGPFGLQGPVVQQGPIVQEDPATAARRVTGEGSQSGRPVTGDAWSGLSRVSGTEGASTQSRNLSERGNPRGMGMNATRFKEEKVEPVAIPDSRITGSSGNTGRGALVTLSGGARG
ncbi:MAG: CsoS2 family carboxysome shell protein, partial [Thiobacillus sp.]